MCFCLECLYKITHIYVQKLIKTEHETGFLSESCLVRLCCMQHITNNHQGGFTLSFQFVAFSCPVRVYFEIRLFCLFSWCCVINKTSPERKLILNRIFITIIIIYLKEKMMIRVVLWLCCTIITNVLSPVSLL